MFTGFRFPLGDFVPSLKRILKLVTALRESDNSREAFNSLINELVALKVALSRVQRLQVDEKHQAELLALRQLAVQCQQSIDRLWDNIAEYQLHLQHYGIGYLSLDTWYSVKWALRGKDEVEKFRAEMHRHTRHMGILLLSLQGIQSQLEELHPATKQATLARLVHIFSFPDIAKLGVINNALPVHTVKRVTVPTEQTDCVNKP